MSRVLVDTKAGTNAVDALQSATRQGKISVRQLVFPAKARAPIGAGRLGQHSRPLRLIGPA